jgi:hypothetical protein
LRHGDQRPAKIGHPVPYMTVVRQLGIWTELYDG